MKYKITIVRKDDNPNYAAEIAKFEESDRRMNRGMNSVFDEGLPQKQIITDALICELTEEQFKKVRAEVFKVFE